MSKTVKNTAKPCSIVNTHVKEHVANVSTVEYIAFVKENVIELLCVVMGNLTF